MPRRKKDGAAQIAAILAKFDIKTEKPVVPEQNYQSDTATAVFSWAPAHFKPNKCGNKKCGKIFSHNQIIPHGSRVGYCSDPCRRESWKDSTGLDWFVVDTKREPWDGDPPLIISPEQFTRLEAIAKWFTRNQKLLETLRQDTVSELEEYPEAIVFDPIPRQLPQEEFDLFGGPESYESGHQRQEVPQTILAPEPEPSSLEQRILANDPFGF